MLNRSVTRSFILFLLLAAVVPWGLAARAEAPASVAPHPGAALYEQLCANCHGKSGEGVQDEYADPLIGERPLASLTRRVQRTMPDDDPGSLTDEQAAQISSFIYDAFYSPSAQARLRPPEVHLARLTVAQFRNSLADLVGKFRGGFEAAPQGEKGLKGHYSGFAHPKPEEAPVEKPKNEEEKKEREKARFERIDRHVSFSFGGASPDPEKMIAEEFRVRWEGSILAEDTGMYEFIIRSENGARLNVNHSEKPLIDAWVSAGGDPREEKKSIFLLGGRHYPLTLEFFKYKDKTASIQLLWKTPHGVTEIIPERVVTPKRVRPTFLAAVPFPADDRSDGYERGTGVSKEWQKAVIDSATATADFVEEELNNLAKTKADAPDRIEKLKEFARGFIQTAFRRPIDDGHRAFVEAQFAAARSPEIAIRRIVLFTVSSPTFLYPGAAAGEKPDAYELASRLALTLWDSLPDEKLLQTAASGKLLNPAEINFQARRMVTDARAKAKLHGFFHHWLELDRGDAISKDPEAFPGFDEAIIADLRTSLTLFIDQVVWGERSDYRELLQADYLLLNDRLAKFYGKEGASANFERVNFDRKERAGIVTHPYLMTSFAHARYTSPIHRGVFLTRNVLGLSLKNPAVAIAFEDSKFDPSFTMREKITELTRDTSCMGCHSTINPLGFALEQYDAVGRWRTMDNQKPVDPRGELLTDDGETLNLAGARDIADFAARNTRGHRAFVRQLFHHALKQQPEAYGSETLDKLVSAFAAQDFHIVKLLTEMAVQTVTFEPAAAGSAHPQRLAQTGEIQTP